MSYRRPGHGSIRGWPMIVLAAMAIPVLTACSSTGTAGHPKTTPTGTAGAPKTSYDVAVYLCNDLSRHSGTCASSGAPGTQLATVRSELKRDPSIRYLLFLTEPDNYRLAQKTLPADQLKYLKVGDLPAAFLVSLVGGAAAEPAFAAKYSQVDGIQTVTSCQQLHQPCSVKLLHSVGIAK